MSTTVIPFNNKRPANDAAATLAMPAETVDLRLPRDCPPRGDADLFRDHAGAGLL